MDQDNFNKISQEYFAKKPAEKCASVLLNRAQSFFNILYSSFFVDKIARSWRFYYGAYNNEVGFGHRTEMTGEQGELTSFPVNHYRNIAQHIYNMITANRPTMTARAINTDYKSLAQTYLADGILDYYMREKGLEDVLLRAAEMAIVVGSSYVRMEWNATSGEAFDADPDTGEIVYEGEVEFSVLSPLDVVMDGTKESWDNDWLIVRSFKNKYDLIAKFPELADKINSIPSKDTARIYRLAIFTNDETDDIPVYEFYHKRTESMPDGRYMMFLSPDVVLMDTKMPYRVMPIYRLCPSEILGTPYGYTPMYDLMPMQESVNALYSTIMTNQNAFGVQSVYVPRGADISVEQLEGGMNIIEADGKPEPIQLTATPPEVFKFLDYVVRTMETVSGVNSVTRGNPEASLKSGTALALVQSMSLQFMSAFQKNYVKLIEATGTGLIQILKDFAKAPKVVALVGRNNRSLLKSFTGEDINAINRVVVDLGNPLAKCLAKDTPVLMHNGTIKLVQDVKVGDLVMGPDSGPRTVSHVNTGTEMMYEVTSKDPLKSVKYGCNESHILTLRYCSDDFRYGAKKGDLLDISVKDFLQLPKRQQRLLQGFTTGVEFTDKKLDIPPYILGAWLGDGNSRTTSITSMDIQLVDEIYKYANSIGMCVRVEENTQPNKSKNYFITSGERSGSPNRNPFMSCLRELELIENKHIPFVYLTSSRASRLELLAGLLDTDGYRIDETFIFTQKSQKLTDDVVYLAKSLGFRVTLKQVEVQKSKLVPNASGVINKISIGGDTWEIPTRITRKQAKIKSKSRNCLNYGINVTSVGEGVYYGFTLEEEPHFLLGDFTVTHNTVAGRVQMAEQMMQMKIIKDPNQYFQVMNTGRLDVTYEGEMTELLNIKRENEDLLDGTRVTALILDDHRQHISEHKSILADPDLRKDPLLVENVLEHIQQHIELLKNGDPLLLSLSGQEPIQPPQQPPQGPLQNSPMSSMLAQQPGQIVPGEHIQGPGVENIGLPKNAKVNASLLPNPELQEQYLNNVKE